MAERPPFVLCYADDQQGCGRHRIMMPLASLVEAGVADGRADMAPWPDAVIAACAPDVIVFQRFVEDAQIAAMIRWRQLLPAALFIYELDDYLAGVPVLSFHAGFMPRDMAARISRALAVCDRVSTTTEPMAQWLGTLAPSGMRIDVIANGLPVSRLRERPARTMGKLRVGFAGGISHTGDLELLRTAMETIGDAVTWVFFGMAIKNPPVDIEFHDGVPVSLYLDKLASLDIDLILAPLEDNAFNRCKSNLRLVEAAAIGAAAIAQDLTPYHLHNPPVFAHAKTPVDWARAIDMFLTAGKTDRQRSVDALRTWAGRYYTTERLLPARMKAWLPDDVKPWRPSSLLPPQKEKLVVASTDLALPFRSFVRTTLGLEEACRLAVSLGADLLWLRPATTFDVSGLGRLQRLLRGHEEFASVVPLTNDGPNGFPRTEPWFSMPPETTVALIRLTAELFGERFLKVNAPSGPVVLVSLRGLLALGLPDVVGCDGNEEQALMEWGLRAALHGWKHGQALGTFAGSLTPPVQPTRTAVIRLQARGLGEQLNNTPDTSKLTGEERAQLEMCLLRAQWGGPRPGSMGFANDYEAWAVLRSMQLPPVLVSESSDDVYVRAFGAENDWSEDSYIIFVDDTVRLQDAVYWVKTVLARPWKRRPMVIYGDNETIIGDKKSPEFKPDFDPVLFLAQDYISPVCAVHASMFQAAPANRTELFQVLLNIWNSFGVKAFHHIPRILGSLRLESKPETMALETLERQQAIEKTFGGQVTVKASRQIIGCLTVTRNWKTVYDEAPLVSFVVPTLGSGRLIQPCVATVLQHTAYPNYEIIVVQNGIQRDTPDLSEAVLADPRVHVVHYAEGFNWAKINNWAIRDCARGDYIVTLNDDVCVGSLDRQWLDQMMGHAVRTDVGAVGARLVHPAGVVQHIGVVCHNGIAGHMHKGTPAGQAGHLGRILLAHEAAAVTGACMLFTRHNFEAVGGFDTSWPDNYNDVVFCIEQRRQGRRIVVETSAELLHPEASSRADSSTPEGLPLLRRDNVRLLREYPEADPYWNPNMMLAAHPETFHINGLNADSLAWADFTPRPECSRVLLINDAPGAEGCVLEILRKGDVPFMADLSGFSLQLSAPGALNIPPWDIRDADRVAKDLRVLGISRIVLRSLVGYGGAAPPVETLRMLSQSRLGIPVDIQPRDLVLVAPWLVRDGRVNEQKLFGYVDMAAWQAAYVEAVKLQGEEVC